MYDNDAMKEHSVQGSKYSIIQLRGIASLEALVWLSTAIIMTTLLISGVLSQIEHLKLNNELSIMRHIINSNILSSSRLQRDVNLIIQDNSIQSFDDVTNTLLNSHQSRYPYKVNGEEKGSLYFSQNGVTSPATITVSGKRWQCNLVISLRGRIRESCSDDR